MVADIPNEMDLSVKSFLLRVVEWAKNEPGLLALALVGSHARGEAVAESDVDLILLFTNPEAYLKTREWVHEFGKPVEIIKEDWGKVTSLRVTYANGLEVEYGLSGFEWGSDPKDEGDAQVIRDGLIVLYEKNEHLSSKLNRFNSMSS
jgi:predicted nucleotidyltransferase